MKKGFLAVCLFFYFNSNAQVQTEYFSNGKKKSEGEYSNTNGGASLVYASDGSTRQAPSQTKTGTWNYWFDSGLKSAEESYINGQTSGIWKSWYPDGKASVEINYTTGKASFWYKNGAKQSEGDMLPNRIFSGKWTGWFENGNKSYEGNYKDGKKEGEWNWFDESGKLTHTQNYKQDVLLENQK